MPTDCPVCGTPLRPMREGTSTCAARTPSRAPRKVLERVEHIGSRGAFDIEALGEVTAAALTQPVVPEVPPLRTEAGPLRARRLHVRTRRGRTRTRARDEPAHARGDRGRRPRPGDGPAARGRGRRTCRRRAPFRRQAHVVKAERARAEADGRTLPDWEPSAAARTLLDQVLDLLEGEGELWRGLLVALGIRNVGPTAPRALAQEFQSMTRLREVVEGTRPSPPKAAVGRRGVGPTIVRSLVDWFATPWRAAIVDAWAAAGVRMEDAAAGGVTRTLEVTDEQDRARGLTVVVTGGLERFSRDEAKEAIIAAAARPRGASPRRPTSSSWARTRAAGDRGARGRAADPRRGRSSRRCSPSAARTRCAPAGGDAPGDAHADGGDA